MDVIKMSPISPATVVLILLVISPLLINVVGQVVLLPGVEVADPFKDNPKWSRFKLEQHERIQQLKVLVDNVWNLFDDIEDPSPSFDFKGSFIKYQFQSFLDYFQQIEHQLHTQSVYLTMKTALGKEEISSSDENDVQDSLHGLRVKWLDLNEMAKVIHQIFNTTSTDLFAMEPSAENKESIFKSIDGMHSVDGAVTDTTESGEEHEMSIYEIAQKIDSAISNQNEDKQTLIRGLVSLLQNMEQDLVARNEVLNYYCYGNNIFGLLPDLIDVVSNSLLYLVSADMKKLVLDIYKLTYLAFYDEGKFVKEELLKQRDELWTEMVERVDRKVNFTYLDGKGWNGLEGPIIYKCDLPPPAGHERYKQWGRNLTTGAHPNASHVLDKDPQAGPLKADGTLGYYDDRTPGMDYVAFERTFRGYIESEMILNPNGNCVGTCNDYRQATKLCHTDHCPLQRGFHCSPNEPDCLSKSSCSIAKKCVRAGPAVEVCSAGSSSRFDWIRYNNKVITSNNGTFNEQCSGQEGDPKSLSTVSERWHLENNLILEAPVYCELCLCTCIASNNPEDQDYFDLQPAAANIEEGYVITALKFVKEKHVIRLAVQEGKPFTNGNIDEDTLHWVEPKEFDTSDAQKTPPLGLNGFSKLNFDVLVGPPGTVLTGIRFNVDETSAINMEIQVAPITWSDGDDEPKNGKGRAASLETNEAQWISNTSLVSPFNSKPRQPLNFPEPIKNPLSQAGPSMPDAVANSFVEFTTTSYEIDLAQSIVPYFDAQSVYYYHEGKCWLRGAGLMHKGKFDSTGFITPLIIAAKPFSVTKYFPNTE